MLGIDPASPLALSFRRLRSRLGWSAPRMTVRMELPWPVRALSVVLLAAASIALAGWIYDAGRQFAGYHSQSSEEEVAALRTQVQRLATELEEARKVGDAGQSRLQIETTAREKLSLQIRSLEEENTRLKADLAMFENLASNSQTGPPGLEISRLTVSPEGTPGRFRFSALIAQKGLLKDRDLKASLHLMVAVSRGGETVMMEFPMATSGGSTAGYPVTLRRFGKAEGVFDVPAGARIGRVEARLVEDGTVKARHAVTL